MGSLVFIFGVGFLGYILGDGMFGAKLINAFEYINVLYWIGFMFLILINAAIIVGLSFAGQDKFQKFGSYSIIGSLGGASLGLVIAMVTLFIPILQLWILSNIPLTIDPNISSFDEIQDKTYIMAFSILAILGAFFKGTKK